MTSRFTSFTRTALTAASLLVAGAAFAQMPPPPPAGPVPGAPLANGPGAAPLAVPQAGTVVNGQVQRWLLNPNGDADGLLLADGTQVAFPPHLSARLSTTVKPGDTVQVSGWRAPNAPVLRAMTITANGQSVTDTPPALGEAPPAPPTPGALTALVADGRIARLLYNDRGDVHGAVLDNGAIVRFPPHIGAQYAALLQPGAPLFARGWGTRNALGTALEATSLGQSASAANDVFAPPGAVGATGVPGAQPVPPTRLKGHGPRTARPTPPTAPAVSPAAPVVPSAS
ncbi:hypothetical protein [Variovorax ginsengisoli]|uniref:Secreted protein n=1 Tax=Variovorax ginsengisoli TaxID=363844 RepID=A0ABT9SAE5_9BURK|nr:hypothetical protein [Variovorax ginsengisoli]MDP9901334.1 hypothetical protein [Variovorax ginsengisoli]